MRHNKYQKRRKREKLRGRKCRIRPLHTYWAWLHLTVNLFRRNVCLAFSSPTKQILTTLNIRWQSHNWWRTLLCCWHVWYLSRSGQTVFCGHIPLLKLGYTLVCKKTNPYLEKVAKISFSWFFCVGIEASVLAYFIRCWRNIWNPIVFYLRSFIWFWSEKFNFVSNNIDLLFKMRHYLLNWMLFSFNKCLMLCGVL